MTIPYKNPELSIGEIEIINNYIRGYLDQNTEEVRKTYEENKCQLDGRGLAKTLYALYPIKRFQHIAAREVLRHRDLLKF